MATMSEKPAPEWKVWPSLYKGMAAAVVEDVEPLRTIAEVRRFEDAKLLAAAPALLRAAVLLEEAEDFNANDCRECEGQGVPELCPVCFPKFDDARVARRAAIAKAEGKS